MAESSINSYGFGAGDNPPDLMATYEKRELIGKGGMGAVYRAIQHPLGREVALKFIQGDLDPESVGRFRREIDAGSRLSHPNVIKVFDVGELEGQTFLAMQLIRNATTLAQLIQEHGPIETDLAIRIVKQILDGLAHVHDSNYLHRDIKPANVMIDDQEHVTLMDFGLVKRKDSTMLTEEGMAVGTLAYMSPEVLAGAEATPASDLWAVGLILCELMTGTNPYLYPSIQETLVAIIENRLPPQQNRGGPLDSQAIRFIERSLERDPGDRVRNAREAMSILQPPTEEATLQTQRIPARDLPVAPDGSRRPARESRARFRSALARGAAIVALALVTVTGLVVSYSRAPGLARLPSQQSTVPELPVRGIGAKEPGINEASSTPLAAMKQFLHHIDQLDPAGRAQRLRESRSRAGASRQESSALEFHTRRSQIISAVNRFAPYLVRVIESQDISVEARCQVQESIHELRCLYHLARHDGIEFPDLASALAPAALSPRSSPPFSLDSGVAYALNPDKFQKVRMDSAGFLYSVPTVAVNRPAWLSALSDPRTFEGDSAMFNEAGYTHPEPIPTLQRSGDRRLLIFVVLDNLHPGEAIDIHALGSTGDLRAKWLFLAHFEPPVDHDPETPIVLLQPVVRELIDLGSLYLRAELCFSPGGPAGELRQRFHLIAFGLAAE